MLYAEAKLNHLLRICKFNMVVVPFGSKMNDQTEILRQQQLV